MDKYYLYDIRVTARRIGLGDSFKNVNGHYFFEFAWAGMPNVRGGISEIT